MKQINFDRHSLFLWSFPTSEIVRLSGNISSQYRKGPKIRGNKSLLSIIDKHGLVLKYIKKFGRHNDLCGMFGVVSSTVSFRVYYSLNLLLKCVLNRKVEDFRVNWSSRMEMDNSANLLRLANRPNGCVLPKVFAVMDGRRMLCADYEYEYLHDAFFEGYTGNLEVTYYCLKLLWRDNPRSRKLSRNLVR